MAKTVLIVGKNFSSLKNYIINHNMEYVLLKDILTTTNPEKHIKRRFLCDFSQYDLIDAAIARVNEKHDIDAVLTVYENYIVPAAYIAERLNLPGMPIPVAEACTDKYIMRQLFAKAPKKISPDFAEVKSLDDVIGFERSHGFPLILKPANLAKSLLVTKSHNIEELQRNYTAMCGKIDDIYNKYAPTRKPKIIIEEFMEGPIHSVDAFVDADGKVHVLDKVVDYQTGYDIGYDDNFHYSRLLPSKLSQEEIDSIRETAVLGCQALGMKSTPAHVEIIRTKEGPMVVEIGARNGGYRERMHALANDIDITGNALALALNRPLDIKPYRNNYCAVLELFPKVPGIFSGIKDEKKLKTLTSLEYYAIKQPLGNYVGKSSDGYKMCAIIILKSDDRISFSKDLDFVNNNVYVLT